MSNDPTVVTNSKTRVNFRTYEQYKSDPDPAKNELQCVEANVIVEHWESGNGSGWYRKWSDGWIEQGGIRPTTSGTGFGSITFPTPFQERVYGVFSSMVRATHAADYRGVGTYSLTAASFGYDSSATPWYACGR